jgi:hypothetical protein
MPSFEEAARKHAGKNGVQDSKHNKTEGGYTIPKMVYTSQGRKLAIRGESIPGGGGLQPTRREPPKKK